MVIHITTKTERKSPVIQNRIKVQENKNFHLLFPAFRNFGKVPFFYRTSAGASGKAAEHRRPMSQILHLHPPQQAIAAQLIDNCHPQYARNCRKRDGNRAIINAQYAC
ncbi:hypothetical protein O8B40_14545 [Agrobacterium rhizogenes]|nr:hypothetical protein [Rhizobium rhizogenes]